MKKIEEKNKILFLVQLPPPIHGVSIMNKAVISNPFFNIYQKKIITFNFSKKISDLRKLTIKKLIKSILIFYKLFYYLLFFKPNIVYFTLFPFGKAFFYRDFFYLTLIKIFNKKVILHFHNIGIETESENKFKLRIYNWVFSNTNIIFLSNEIKKKELKNLSLKKTSFFIVPNGIPVIDKNEYLKSKKNYLNILFFSNFIKEKGLFLLLDAFRELSKKYDNIKLIIAGQDFDNNKQKIKKLVLDYNLQKKVTIKTNLYGKEKNELFADTDIFVFPSFFKEEAFPLVILEAMQMQLPIVASNIGAITDIIQDEKNGLLFKSKNKEELTKKIETLILNKDLRNRLGQQARNNYKNKYTANTFNKCIVDVFNEVCI